MSIKRKSSLNPGRFQSMKFPGLREPSRKEPGCCIVKRVVVKFFEGIHNQLKKCDHRYYVKIYIVTCIYLCLSIYLSIYVPLHEYSLEGLMLKQKLPYFGHLMQRADSQEKTLMLGKIEGRRRSGQQRKRWLGGIMSLSKLQETVKNGEAWSAAVHGITKRWTRLSDWTATTHQIHYKIHEKIKTAKNKYNYMFLYSLLSISLDTSSPGSSVIKNRLPMQETWVRSLGREDPLEKEMATHSSILAWKSHGHRSPGGHSPWGHKESDTT